METNSKYVLRRRKQEAHPLTIEQIKQLLEAAQDHPLKALLIVAITTGLRQGELLGLRWEDIDIQNGILHVHRIVSSVGGRESTETARTIALSAIALQALKEHLQYQDDARTKTGEVWHNLDLVFSNEIGQSFDPRKLRQVYRALFITVGLPHLRFHDLRRSTMMILLETGISITIIHAMLGFRQRSTSIQTLTPVSLSMQKEAMKMWDLFLTDCSLKCT